ncbi:MAG: radical SAM protein [Candidatus Omnitrophica bacterium]|nr:radical SAM protein [Candidatus Omnitrophota bacterium]
MNHNSSDSEKKNFLFFLNKVHPPSIEDPVIGALTRPARWSSLAGLLQKARRTSSFVSSIKKLQLYVHVPFCERLCKFCHCARGLLKSKRDLDLYIHAVARQMERQSKACEGMDASHICFGGGTPSLLDEKQITFLLDAADAAYPVQRRKIFFETHPSSWTRSKLDLLLDRGLYRLSMGVESLEACVLKQVARSQTRQKVLSSLYVARAAGVPYVNVDLMSGLPGQSIQGLLEDIKKVVQEGANIVHVHPFSSLPVNELCGPQETFVDFFKRRSDMMHEAAKVLKASGFKRKGLGAYALNQAGEDHQEEAYTRLESAVLGFGAYSIGQFPGALFYRTKPSGQDNGFNSLEACPQDLSFVMARYAIMAIITDGLDEKVFLNRFGVSLKQACKGGLNYLKSLGLVGSFKGVWKFSASWEIEHLREYIALSRVLYGEDFLLKLQKRYAKQYNPGTDYRKGKTLLHSFSNHWLMALYYQMGV